MDPPIATCKPPSQHRLRMTGLSLVGKAPRIYINTTTLYPCLTLFWKIIPQCTSSATPLFFGTYAHLTRPYISSATLAPSQSIKLVTSLGMGIYGITPRIFPTSLAYPTSLILTSTGSIILRREQGFHHHLHQGR